MDNTNGSSNKYYSSKTPLNLQGTREGRSNPPQSPTYQQSGQAGGVVSSNKYYAAAKPTPIAWDETARPEKLALAQAAAKSLERKVGHIKYDSDLLSKIIAMYQDGASDIQVSVNADDLENARVVVELAVGQQNLTRAQADSVKFEWNAPEESADEPEAVVEPVKKKATKKKATRKKSKKKESAIKDFAVDELDSETKSELLKNGGGHKATDDITNSDIADAFGIGDDSKGDD
jgi:hypothetical protein